MSIVAIAVGLGAAGTHFFAPDARDLVTDKERLERQVAFTKMRHLQTTEIGVNMVDGALDEMRLQPPERAQLRAMLPAADVKSTTASSPADSTAAAPIATQAASGSPLRLVSVSLWDTHAQDGDVVAIASAGYRRDVTITKAPQIITFPVDQAATLQVIGVRDGGGGITLGIRGPSQEILMPIMSEGQTLSLPVGR